MYPFFCRSFGKCFVTLICVVSFDVASDEMTWNWGELLQAMAVSYMQSQPQPGAGAGAVTAGSYSSSRSKDIKLDCCCVVLQEFSVWHMWQFVTQLELYSLLLTRRGIWS